MSPLAYVIMSRQYDRAGNYCDYPIMVRGPERKDDAEAIAKRESVKGSHELWVVPVVEIAPRA